MRGFVLKLVYSFKILWKLDLNRKNGYTPYVVFFHKNFSLQVKFFFNGFRHVGWVKFIRVISAWLSHFMQEKLQVEPRTGANKHQHWFWSKYPIKLKITNYKLLELWKIWEVDKMPFSEVSSRFSGWSQFSWFGEQTQLKKLC